MIKTELSDVYRDYIACLNKQDWPKLEQFVHDEVCYNGQRIGLLGYREMLERDFYEIPDLYFNIQLLISDPVLPENSSHAIGRSVEPIRLGGQPFVVVM